MPDYFSGPNDYLVASDTALQIEDVTERATRLGDLLEWATNARRHVGAPDSDYGRVIAILRARVSRAIEELRTWTRRGDHSAQPHLDVDALVERLEAIRSARTNPDA